MDAPNPSPDTLSPPWNASTKLVVGLSLVVIFGAALVRFRSMLGPLVLAVMLAYLVYPLASFLDRHTPLSWRGVINLLYLLILAGLFWLLAWSSVVLVQQINGLATLLQNTMPHLPDMLTDWFARTYAFGPWQLDLSQLDTTALSQQVLGVAQSALGQVGALLSLVAGSALQILGWMGFILLVSYFILLDSNGLRESIVRIEAPRYQYDLDHMQRELSRIWNAFLRGQIVLFVMTVFTYTVVLAGLGVRSPVLLALLAGLGRFVPYLGPLVVWTTLGFVAFFQSYKLFGMSAAAYLGLVLGVSILIDQIFDNLISPRLMGRALRVHPAGVLVAALVGANLFGLLGVVLAAPLLATLKLVLRYVYRKLFDLPPWEDDAPPPPPPTFPWWGAVQARLNAWRQKKSSQRSTDERPVGTEN